jgi:peptidoglycan/LPS O-acetylase OafA/YrhL
MYIFVFISKITKIPAGILLAIPMIAGVVITNVTEFSIIPFLSTRIARGYIHFFGGLLIGIIISGLFGKKSEKNNNEIIKDKDLKGISRVGFILKNSINKVGEATLDIYLIQLPMLLLFFIIAHYTGLNLVSGKTMLLYALSTFVIGGLYYFLIGKRIHILLSKTFFKKK